MKHRPPITPSVAIACGGTGGHLYPGLAVAGALMSRGCAAKLLISPKDVDQNAVKGLTGIEVTTLPAVGLTRERVFGFLMGFHRSYRAAMRLFRPCYPQAVLAMGGFTSAPPILAARRLGISTFLHESNTIPGRANRWLAWVADGIFVGFPSAIARLHNSHIKLSGTPVRPAFMPRDPGSCKEALGLDPAKPVVVVMGGSQGARGINDLVERSLPVLAKRSPDWQWFHLAGPQDAERLRRAYAAAGVTAVVHAFFSQMESALGAGTAAISRAGASSLAELAAVRLPAVLVPYPAATDNHQFHNATAFERTGAARLLEQANATTEQLVQCLSELVTDAKSRSLMQLALAQWHTPRAADTIAETILSEAWQGGGLGKLRLPQEGGQGEGRRDRTGLLAFAALHPKRPAVRQLGDAAQVSFKGAFGGCQ